MRDEVQAVIYAKPDALAKRQDAMVAYVHAIGRAEAYLHKNTGEARALLKEYDAALSDAAINALLTSYIPVLPQQPSIAPESYEKALQFHRVTGFAADGQCVCRRYRLKHHSESDPEYEMKLCRFGDNRFGVVRDDRVYDVTEYVAKATVAAPLQRGDSFIANLAAITKLVDNAAFGEPPGGRVS